MNTRHILLQTEHWARPLLWTLPSRQDNKVGSSACLPCYFHFLTYRNLSVASTSPQKCLPMFQGVIK